MRVALTAQGLRFILLIGIVGFAAYNNQNNLLYLMTSAGLAGVLIGVVAGWASLRGLAFAGSELPDAYAEVPFREKVLLANSARVFNAFGLAIEPAEPAANESVSIPLLETGSRGSCRVERLYRCRGRYQCEPVRVVTRFPFGFFRVSRKLAAPRDIIVFPRIRPIDSALLNASHGGLVPRAQRRGQGDVVLLAAVVFVALPRAAYGGFRLGGLTGITVTGFSERVRLGDFEEIQRDTDVVMRILSDETEASPPRWRGPAYDRYQGGEWRQSLSGVSALPRGRRGRFLLDRPTSAPHARSEVFVEPLDTDVLFLPPASSSIDTTERYVFVDPYLTLRTGRSRRAGRHYAVSWRHLETPASSPVGGVERLTTGALRLYTQVPESLSTRFHELAQRVVAGRPDSRGPGWRSGT